MKRSHKRVLHCSLVVVAFSASTSLLRTNADANPDAQTSSNEGVIQNPLIDYNQFQSIVDKSEAIREGKRLTEIEYAAAMDEPKVVILDARSEKWFKERHLVGAVSLPFTDWTEETLAAVVPTKDTKILIYCNNNFLGDQRAFATKSAPASLNLSSYTSLVAYGYTNVWELGPLLAVDETVLPMEGTGAPVTE